MFGKMKLKEKEKNEKSRKAKIENGKILLEGFLRNQLAVLEKLVSEEAELREVAEAKRCEIIEQIEQLEKEMALFKQELLKIGFHFPGLFGNGETEKENIEGQLSIGAGESGQVGEIEKRIKLEQEDLELRLQSKEEENNLLKNRVAELEEQLRVIEEKKKEEIQEVGSQVEQGSGQYDESSEKS